MIDHNISPLSTKLYPESAKIENLTFVLMFSLNLLNKLRKIDKMQGLHSILSL